MCDSHVFNLEKYSHRFYLSLIVATCSIGFSQNTSATTIDIQALFSGTGEKEYAGGFLCDNGSSGYTPTSATGSMQVGSDSAGCDADNRAAVEFDISMIVDSNTIGTATLSFTTESGSSIGIDIHGYAGNGTKDKPDFNFDNQIASFTAVVNTTSQIDVTDYVKFLVDNNDSYAGFMLDCPPTVGTLCESSDNKFAYIFGIDSAFAPKLSISSVPIPAAFWLFGTGALGFIGLVRRKA